MINYRQPLFFRAITVMTFVFDRSSIVYRVSVQKNVNRRSFADELPQPRQKRTTEKKINLINPRLRLNEWSWATSPHIDITSMQLSVGVSVFTGRNLLFSFNYFTLELIIHFPRIISRAAAASRAFFSTLKYSEQMCSLLNGAEEWEEGAGTLKKVFKFSWMRALHRRRLFTSLLYFTALVFIHSHCPNELLL